VEPPEEFPELDEPASDPSTELDEWVALQPVIKIKAAREIRNAGKFERRDVEIHVPMRDS